MAPNVIDELDTQLASLNQLKAPGASKNKIASITTLCGSNIQAELQIVNSLYRALKKAPATHKLGAIYVIDSVVRKWIELAKQNGQDLHVEGRGDAGTFPAAVKRVTELMPALFEDTFKHMPSEQREKLQNMIKIWDKAHTFPPKMLAEFRAKLTGEAANTPGQTNGTASSAVVSEKVAAPVPTRPVLTPVGYPPQYLFDQGLINQTSISQPSNGTMVAQPQQAPPQQQTQPAAPQQDVHSILAALANIPKPAPPPAQAPQPAPQPPQSVPAGLPPNLAALFGQQQGGGAMPQYPPQQQQQPAYSAPQQAPPFQIPQGFPGFPPQPPPSIPQQYAQAPPPQPPPQQADPLAQLRGILPPNILNDQQKLVEALKLLQEMQRDGIPMEQWGPVIEAFDSQYRAPAAGGFDQYGGRRSRSPGRGAGRRRASPVYGSYEDIARNQGGQSGANRYRQRSPMRNSPMPIHSGGTAMNGMPMQPKYIAIDNSLPRDHIKVLSRTLFVGGASGSQQEIQELFERYGRVQTCIANREKRHAFVKMTTRKDAINAKEQVERLQSSNDREVMNIARQTKWGVGFGPRECCNYQKGESIIPIEKLTDADLKWLLTAEYGGTGGKQVEGGMVLEEPDIEIGAGVSSKAMSKRVLPDAGGAGANKRQRGDDQRNGGNNAGRDRRRDEGPRYGGGNVGYAAQQPVQMENYGYPPRAPEPVAVATPPAVPTFGGFALPGNGQVYR